MAFSYNETMQIVANDWSDETKVWFGQDKILVTNKTTTKRTKVNKGDILECEKVAAADGAYEDKMFLNLDLNDFNEV